MGIYDRDYYRSTSRSSIGGMAVASITTWLILINIGVFIVDQVLKRPGGYAWRMGPDGQPEMYRQTIRPLLVWGSFTIVDAIKHLQLWRFITFQFLHENVMHIFGNMLCLYFFGPMIESYLGRNRYLLFYLLCGIAGPFSFMALCGLHVLGADLNTQMIGASAGIFGVLIAGACIAPNATVMLLFPPIPMRLKTMAWLMIALAAYTAFTNGRNAGGEAAHLGGAALGYLLITHPHWLPSFRRKPRWRGWG